MVCCKQTWFIPLIVDLSSLLSEIIYVLSKSYPCSAGRLTLDTPSLGISLMKE